MGLFRQKWLSRTEPGRGDKDGSGQGAPIAAMERLQAGVDCSVIALWLGHESIKTTQVYLHAHLALKEAALAKVKPFNGQKGARYKPSDRLLAFLDAPIGWPSGGGHRATRGTWSPRSYEAREPPTRWRGDHRR